MPINLLSLDLSKGVKLRRRSKEEVRQMQWSLIIGRLEDALEILERRTGTVIEA